MVVKAWLQERLAALLLVLAGLTVEQEEEIKRVCEEELAYWRDERGLSLSSLRGTLTAARNAIKEIKPLTAAISWRNPRTQQIEHIALKYLNLSTEEWAAANAPSREKQAAREEEMKYIDDPAAVIGKAVELLSSPHWYDLAVGLAVLTGRRLTELVEVGELFPKSIYTVIFSGQLKRRDKVLPPYEIPVLWKAVDVLAAWARLRCMPIGADGRLVSAAADRHFSKLVPPRSGGDLYTHLHRAVYGALA